jgi:hypothetical protein
MEKQAYYLLLSSLASLAVAGCGDDDSCPHTVTLKERTRTVSADTACQIVSVDRSGFGPRWGVTEEKCGSLCEDQSMNRCDPSDEYLAAVRTANGAPVSYPEPDASVAPITCPTWQGAVPLLCAHEETRGKWHQDCPVDGRRPRGMRAFNRSDRAEVGGYLARSAYLEAASVLAFEQLARALAELGAPPQLVADCRDAAREEVGHARVIGALACARGAALVEVELGAQSLPSRLELALDNIVEGVVRETYGALQAIVRARTASARDVRAAMVRIARDESSHAALSLRIAAWLDTQLSADERAQVAHARGAAIAELRRELAHEPSPALRDQLGLPSRTLALGLIEQLEARVWQQVAPPQN